MKRFLLSMAALAFVLSVALPAQAYSVNYFTDKAAWEAALLTGYSTENFNDETLNSGLTITSSNGYTISGGLFQDQVNESLKTSFEFVPMIYALGGIWDLAGPGGPGQGIQGIITLFFANGETAKLDPIPNTTAGTFWGFVLNGELFDKIELSGFNPQTGWVETYTLDDLAYASPCCNPVPIPAAVWLLGSGVVGLVGLRRKMSA